MRIPNVFNKLEALTAGQRKLLYLGGIVVLLVGAIILGAPATGDEGGGLLPQMRVEYKLGESTLGDVDPSSSTMNLVLLGLRGIAANVLWMEHEELSKTKNWARMEDTVNSIITLQPHFLQVWRYHGWNLAYNVSAQWDDVRDRYFWVKKGTKFTMEGVDKNQNYAELPWDVGRYMGGKIGRSDEWRSFRKFFLKDPDPRYDGKQDKKVNPEGEDNYLVASKWYQRANDQEEIVHKETGKGQSQMMRELFRHYPSRSLFDWADSLHREGTFGEASNKAWRMASDNWDNKYGKFRFVDDYKNRGIFWLNADEDDIQAMLQEDKAAGFDVTASVKRNLINLRQNTTNYRYWQSRAKFEKSPEMVAAHRDMYRGRQLWRSGNTDWHVDGTPPESVQRLEQGLKTLESQISQFAEENLKPNPEDPKPRNPTSVEDPSKDTNLIDEAMLAIYYYQQAHKLHGKKLPDDYPMKKFWEEHEASQLEDIKQEFRRDLGGLSGR